MAAPHESSELTGRSYRELALRLADALALVRAVPVDPDTNEADIDGGAISAIECALTGESGCLEPDEWEQEREGHLVELADELGIDLGVFDVA